MRYTLHLFTILLVVSCEPAPLKNQELKSDLLTLDTLVDSTNAVHPLVLDSVVDEEKRVLNDSAAKIDEDTNFYYACLSPNLRNYSNGIQTLDFPSGFVVVSYRLNDNGETYDVRLEKSLHEKPDAISLNSIMETNCDPITRPWLLKKRFRDTIMFGVPKEMVKEEEEEEEEEEEVQIDVYPNPFNTHITVSSKKNAVIQYVEVFDIQGALLKRVEPNSETARIETSDFKPGTYFLKVIDERNKVVKVQTMIKA